MGSEGVARVAEFIKRRGLGAEVLEFSETVESVESASRASRVPPHSIVKTLILVVDDEPYAVLVPGDRRLDLGKLRRLLGARRARLAKPSELEEIVGLKPGEVSPLVESVARLRVVLDKEVLGRDVVLVGGGSIHHLVKVRVSELVSVLNPIVADVSEPG
ncbi:MAG: YbaK/EbsC family protein [Pyrodictiaceae archaeon]